MSDNEAAIERIAKDIFMSDNSNAADPEKEWDNALAADKGYARHIARGLHSLGYTHSIVHGCCVEAEAAKASKPKGYTHMGLIRRLGKQLDSWESEGHTTVGIDYLRRHFNIPRNKGAS